jgi:hypothetical protein
MDLVFFPKMERLISLYYFSFLSFTPNLIKTKFFHFTYMSFICPLLLSKVVSKKVMFIFRKLEVNNIVSLW